MLIYVSRIPLYVCIEGFERVLTVSATSEIIDAVQNPFPRVLAQLLKPTLTLLHGVSALAVTPFYC